MLTENFYDIVDSEIDAVITRYKTHPAIARYKDIRQKKAYGFMIWFLEFYGKLHRFNDYITNGKEDASCDIIFDRTDSNGNTVYYIVQAKWYTRDNALGHISARDIKYSLNDFETILRRHKKKNRNEKFNDRYQSLLDHLDRNGRVKFIFLALAGAGEEYKDNIESFNKNNAPNSSVEIIDIERIKRDYIDLEYKGIIKETPLETHLEPFYSKITLQVERFADVPGKGDIIKKGGRYRAYVIMVKPRVIYELFKTFGFLLFFQNIRNPLPKSNYNAQMARTLKKDPGSFWYFNNGITAISKIIPEIGNEAREIEITGLQVINGAQTVYTIYRTYEDSEPWEREVIDKDALVMLRLVDSSSEDFNLEITRYTNSQSPMLDRDFFANDDVQVRLQNVSFNYTYWYERRRGEFRQVPGGIRIVENEFLAAAYLAFFLENIRGAVLDNQRLFVSNKIDPGSLYETVFTEYIKFEDMLASFLVIEKILDFIYLNLKKPGAVESITMDFHDDRFLLALAISPIFKIVFNEYLSLKFNEPADQINLTQYVLKNPIEKNVVAKILLDIARHLNLMDSQDKIKLETIKGKEAIKVFVDIVDKKKIDEKSDFILNTRALGFEFFEQDKTKAM